MAIDLRGSLSGPFQAAVFLTYTLNLQFFEQLVAPILDATGCTTVVILVDAAGYDEALANGARTLGGPGMRYVCARMRTQGPGIQHGKFVLLTGSTAGRLLVGSGNLTLPGFGRNLELFERFDATLSDSGQVESGDLAPFREIGRLLAAIAAQPGQLTDAAQGALTQIRSISPWLSRGSPQPAGRQLWHSADSPLLTRIATLGPVDELQILSPFFDLPALRALMEGLQPKRLRVGVDLYQPHLDGPALQTLCAAASCALEVIALEGRGRRRPLHAKAFIGITASGSWCVSGSANCTRPAILGRWHYDGNLELVTWRHSDDPGAFEALWNDADIQYLPQPPEALAPGPGLPERPAHCSPIVELLELRCQHGSVTGRVHLAGEVPADAVWEVSFLRSTQRARITVDVDGSFRAPLSLAQSGAEAGRVEISAGGEPWLQTAYLWLDQPVELARYAQRSFFDRVRDNITTFHGSGQLFQNLLNFLWARISPEDLQGQQRTIAELSVRTRPATAEAPEPDEAPPVEAFIVDDDALVAAIHRRLGGGYGGSAGALSLQDLLSLALLRLTEPTQPVQPEPGEGEEPDPELEAQVVLEHERRQRSAMEQARGFLLDYCKRYARRLGDPAFVAALEPARIFENHAVLGRVLLEVADKCETLTAVDPVFTREDLQQCALAILGSLAWPAGAGLRSPSVWEQLRKAGHGVVQLQGACDAADLTLVAAELIAHAWGSPPPWEHAIRNSAMVQTSLRVQRLLRELEQTLGAGFWGRLTSLAQGVSLFGFRAAVDITQPAAELYCADETIRCLEAIAAYKTPVEERYAPLLAWAMSPARDPRRVGELQSRFPDEFPLVQGAPSARPFPCAEHEAHCPSCRMQLAQNVRQHVQRGRLALCNNCRRAILYACPKLNV